MDDRENVRNPTCYRSHSRPVEAVKVTDRHVLSLSWDKTLVVYDRVAGQEFKRINIPARGSTYYLSLQDNSLYVGDRIGGLHLFDASQDRFSLVASYDTGHQGKLSSISAGLGSVVTAASDGTVRVFQPDRGMALINTVKVLMRIISGSILLATISESGLWRVGSALLPGVQSDNGSRLQQQHGQNLVQTKLGEKSVIRPTSRAKHINWVDWILALLQHQD